jgi:hypothetical protein
MSHSLMRDQVRRILIDARAATTGELLRGLSVRGYVGTPGYLTWFLFDDDAFVRRADMRWELQRPSQNGHTPARHSVGTEGHAFGACRCGYVGRGPCTQATACR